MDREDIKMFVKEWWDIYEDESLDYKNIIAPSGVEPGKLGRGPSVSALSTDRDGLVDQRIAPSSASIKSPTD